MQMTNPMDDIYKKYNIDIRKLKRDYYRIPLKTGNGIHGSEYLSKEELYYLYIELNLRKKDICVLLHCNEVRLSRMLKRLKIKKPSNLVQKNKELTFFKKYGVNNPSKVQNVKDKIKKTCLTRYGVEYYNQSPMSKEAHRKTNLLKYGVSNPNKLKSVREKIKKTCMLRYGVDNYSKTKEYRKKFIKTSMKIYGTPHPSQNKVIKDKAKQTNLKKYGVDNYTKTQLFKNIISENKKYIMQKVYETKKKNGTLCSSKIEDKIYILLLSKYPNAVHSYRSLKYPFNCDFYIPSLDLYIEYQGGWQHGAEPFNEHNPKHIEIVNKWKEKAEEINFKGKKKTAYLSAITIWTVRDPLKRKTAKDNNLNWKEFFTEEEFMKWYNSLEKIK